MLPALLLVLHATPAVDYPALKTQLAKLRQDTRVRYQAAGAAGRAKVLAGAREELIRRFEDGLFPAWEGTRWDFNGMTETPREGQIACGYYVSTLMRDAGFRVQRVKLAQQAAANIARTLAPESKVRWYRDLTVPDFVARLRRDLGEGLFVVGLPNHVVFLRVKADGARVCHADYLEPVAVTCEDALESPVLKLNLFVAAPLFDDALLEKWIADEPIATATR